MDTVRQGDTPDLIVTIPDETGSPLNLATATTLQIKLKKPRNSVSNDTVIKTATLYTDGTDGTIIYQVTGASELDVLGQWEIEGYVVVRGKGWHSEVGTFTVERHL